MRMHWLSVAATMVIVAWVGREAAATGDAGRSLKVIPASGPLQGQEVYANSYALLIGVNEYPGFPKQLWLRFAARDATELAALLVRHYGFPEENVALLVNQQARRENIVKNLEAMADQKRFTANDRVLVFFSGHGATANVPGGGEMGFLIPYDAKVELDKPDDYDQLNRTCVPMKTVWQSLEACPSKHVLVIADACYSGLLAAPKTLPGSNEHPVVAAHKNTLARQIMTAGRRGEKSFERTDLGHGAFSYTLIQELKKRAAKVGEVFTTTGVYAALQAPVAQITRSKQTPLLGQYSYAEGEFLFITTEMQKVTDPRFAEATTSSSAVQVRVNPIDRAEMVYIPGGTFQMGSNDGPSDQKPAHSQTVQGFWMYAKEVTNGQYRRFESANPQWTITKVSRDLTTDRYLSHWKGPLRYASSADNYPIPFVSWHAAKAYAEWAGGRLPTEAEWEYAARGGYQLEYPTLTGQADDGLANLGDIGGSTKPGGQYPPNPFGLYDMAGNLWEWCSSLYQPYPYALNDGRENPNASGARVMRGGSYRNYATDCRSSLRTYGAPTSCDRYFGFRVVVAGSGS